MGHHVYRRAWCPFVCEKLRAGMEPNNIKEKYAVAIYKCQESSIIRHLLLGKSSKCAKIIFYVLKAAKENKWELVLGKAVNAGDD